MTKLFVACCVLVIFVAELFGAAVRDLVSEEIRTRIERLPYTILRLAAQKLPRERWSEWLGERGDRLSSVERETDGLPLTRLARSLYRVLADVASMRLVGADLSRTVRVGMVLIPLAATPLLPQWAPGFERWFPIAFMYS